MKIAVKKGEYWAGRQNERMHLFTHYFNAEGTEVGYWGAVSAQMRGVLKIVRHQGRIDF